MTSFVSHTSIDAGNAYELSQWWRQVLDYTDVPGDPNEPDHPECMIQRADGGHRILFLEVPEVKGVKNRIHLDLRPVAGTRDEELARLLSLGARQVGDYRGKYGPGSGWVVLADPEGNEFCILRSQQEVEAQEQTG
ncbi:MAG TPA: VOC family protein [Beutenbergiaceae bacterium]|nr:VOC family protein [Beutenbergiaceae bacterium]